MSVTVILSKLACTYADYQTCQSHDAFDVDFRKTESHLLLSPSVTLQWSLSSLSASSASNSPRNSGGGLNISSFIKKPQQRMYFLPKTMLVNFHAATIESILSFYITVCAAFTAKYKCNAAAFHPLCRERNLQPVSARPVLLQDPEESREDAADPSHPGQKHFETLPSGRRV